MSKLHVITGGAGFIAVNLARALLERGDRVLLIDNLSRGRRSYVDNLGHADRVDFVQADIAAIDELESALSTASGSEAVDVWHLCANSDIPAGIADPAIDLRDTFLVTFNLLQSMRARGWRRLHFASTSAVYGEHGTAPLKEITFAEPISNYGAMKLASEGLIRAWCEATGGQANIFRFPNVVGVPATHGVLLDFTRKLLADPTVLPVLGNGSQRKSYLHATDLVDAMLFIRNRDLKRYQVFNIGPHDDGITVREIAEIARARLAPAARLAFGEGDRGWVGDVPRFNYDVSKLEDLGWRSPHSSSETITRAIDEIAHQESPVGTART